MTEQPLHLHPEYLNLSTRCFRRYQELLVERRKRVRWIHVRSKDGDTMPPGLQRALGEAEAMRAVQWLKIEEIDLGRGGIEAIAASRRLGALRVLYLSDCDWDSNLGNEIATTLAGANGLSALEELDLESIAIGDAGLSTLAASEALPALSRLWISDCRIGDAGVSALLASPLWPRLRALCVACTLSEPVLRAILDAPRPAELERICVACEGRERLAAHFGSAWTDFWWPEAA